MPAYYRNSKLGSQLNQVVEQANNRLRRTPQIKGGNVSCDCDDGVIRLRGRLTSYYKKQVAQEVVKQLDGVTRLVNDGVTELVNEIEVVK
jgi:osmotically-inducible protein OsmY